MVAWDDDLVYDTDREQRDMRLEDTVDHSSFDGCTDYDWAQDDAVVAELRRVLSPVEAITAMFESAA